MAADRDGESDVNVYEQPGHRAVEKAKRADPDIRREPGVVPGLDGLGLHHRAGDHHGWGDGVPRRSALRAPVAAT